MLIHVHTPVLFWLLGVWLIFSTQLMVCVYWWWLQWKPMGAERCAAREIPTPKMWAVPVALGRVLRSCLAESQLPFLCISGQKLDKSWILMRKLEENVRQLQVTGVQVPALSQADARITLPKNCLATTPPPQNVILLFLLQDNRREKRINTLLNLKSTHCQSSATATAGHTAL